MLCKFGVIDTSCKRLQLLVLLIFHDGHEKLKKLCTDRACLTMGQNLPSKGVVNRGLQKI